MHTATQIPDQPRTRSRRRYALGRRFSGVAALALLVAALLPAPAAFAQGTGATLSLAGPKTVALGEEIVLHLRAEGVRGIAGYEAQLLFDKKAAHFTGVQQRHNDLRRFGRGVSPLGAEDTANGVVFGSFSCPSSDCVSRRGNRTPNGRDGSVFLADLHLMTDRAGTLELRLAGVKVVDATGRTLNVAGPRAVTIVRVAGPGATVVHPAPSGAWTLPHNSSPARATDLTGDGIVSNADAMEVATAWTVARLRGDPCSRPDVAAADVNADGCVDVADAQLVAAAYSPSTAQRRTAPTAPQSGVKRPTGISVTAATGPLTFTVNSIADDDDASYGDRVCASAAGQCTLRAAITEANWHGGPDTVAFAIPGTGVHTISLTKSLPNVHDESGPTTIDGYTQPGASANTDPLVSNAVIRIEITGPGEDVAFAALTITSADNVVRGLSFFRMWRSLWLNGAGALRNAIVGDFVGTNAAGTYATTFWNHANGGILIDNGAAYNLIGRPTAADRNVISGNSASGVYHTKEGTSNNLVRNNLIGLNPAGTARIPNILEGVDYNNAASNNTVGGTGTMERNVSSGNAQNGIEVSHGTLTAGNRVIGNFVGTDVTGTQVLSYTGNHNHGIQVEDGVQNTLVSDNVVGGNTYDGIDISGYTQGTTKGTVVTNNRVGVGVNGSNIGNSVGGILVRLRTTNSRIGPGNIIAYNPVGISVQDPDDDYHTITQNSIYSNTGLGIDLAPLNAVNPNDAGDADNGANAQLNFPVISTATTRTVSGTACAGCTVEVFLADSAAGAYGEGRTFIGTGVATGSGTFSVSITGASLGNVVTTTATDPAGDTSEFSLNVSVQAAPPPIAPVADFSWTQDPSALMVAFTDASSNDPTAWSWTFGDGATSTERNPSHTFASAGSYSVSLTASNAGGAGSTTKSVTVYAGVTTYAADTFGRTIAGGWGTANTGGAYSLTGSAADFAVDGSTGRISVPSAGATRTAALAGVSAREVDVRVRVQSDKLATGSNQFAYLLTRRTATGAAYAAKLRFGTNAGVYLQASRLTTSETALGTEVRITGLTHAAGTWFWVRAQVVGSSPTTIRIKTWADGQPEPTGWQFTASDGDTALQAAGGVGLRAYIGSASTNTPVTFGFDDLRVTNPQP